MLQVDYLVLADAAESVQGKQYILGAGWDTLFAIAYPVVHPHMAVALRLRVPWNDTNTPANVVLDIVDGDGHSILPDPPGPWRGTFTVGRPPHLAPGTNQGAVLVVNIDNTTFDRPGPYEIVVRINDAEAARSALNVSYPPGMAPVR
ncbi:MAG: DUF6941 family protein [Dehalococcoidia bacterium]